MKDHQISKEELKLKYREAALELFKKELNSLNANELNSVIAKVIKDDIIKTGFEWAINAYSKKRIAIYFSIEFLIGRVVMDALINCGIKIKKKKKSNKKGP